MNHPNQQIETIQINTTEELEPLYEVSKTTRFLHYTLDLIVFYTLIFGIGFINKLITDQILTKNYQPTLIGVAILFSYYWGFETAFGQTPGKMIMRSIVVTEDGEKPSAWDIFKRTAFRFIPFEAFSFLISRVGWHDNFSKTRVVKK